VHELLHDLPEGALVLDLGCDAGSFDSTGRRFAVVRVDLEPKSIPAANFAQADAAKLPFAANCFELVISNHSLEHFENLEASLEEIGRVVKPTGSLYVGVPDCTTVSDRLYRWLARGGGHVNPFSSAPELALRIERATRLSHVATRTLCTSFAFLNRGNRRSRPPRRLILLGGGTQFSLLFLNYLLRWLDRFLGTRTSVYGWGLYFGNIREPIDCRTWTNVCIRCGSAFSSDWLLYDRKVVRKFAIFSVYRCPTCETLNVLTNDNDYTHFAKA
jgi:SAM-dependent methyltransferase